MTASTLSPTEQDEVTRFGIHDPDVLRDMENRFEEIVPCAWEPCEAPATVHVIARCCGTGGQLCGTHLQQMRDRYAFVLVGQCAYCGVVSIAITFEGAFRVVPL